jgi:iron(III) transport system substrate-binding protein
LQQAASKQAGEISRSEAMKKARALLALVFAAADLTFILSAANAQTEWDKIVAAAKREGKIGVIGPQGVDIRDALTRGFQKQYPEIRVEFNGYQGVQIAPKLLNELRAKRNTTDIVVTGTTTIIESLIPANAVVPVQPFLVGPNARDPSAWRGGKFEFADNAARYNLVMTAYVKAPFIYNPDLAKPSEFKSWHDLLDPKWKGKIVLRDPTGAGGGLGNATFWYSHKDLGKGFIEALFKQNLTVTRDDYQVLNFVGQGKYPIAIGQGDVQANEYVRKGLPVRLLPPEILQEGTYLTAGNGTFAAVRDAPHPNALKVYIDYLLSREGQWEWSKGAGFASLRKDVPRDHVLPILVPKDGADYPPVSSERYVKLRDEVVAFVRPLMAR